MSTTVSHDSDILSRVIRLDEGSLSAEFSQAVLQISFADADRFRSGPL